MTPDEQYAANMALLAQHPSEELRQVPQLLAHCPLTNVSLMPNAAGTLVGAAWDVATQEWIGLCPGDDPAAQAERDVEAIYSPDVKLFTLLGVGLGHAALALARRMRPYQRLSLWEVSPSIFKAMFHAIDTAPLFVDRRVHVFLGPDLLTHVEQFWLSLDVMEKLHIGAPLRAGYTARVDAPVYDALLERTADMLRHHMVGLSTWRMFGQEIGANDLANVPEYFTSPGYEQLAGLWQGRPAVCVAAGPSLQHNLRVLLEPGVREAVAVVTAGTVYALVQGLHVQPDLVTTIDFQRLNWTDQFLHVPLDPACTLVYLHSTYPQTVRRWPGPRFVAENASDTMSFFRRFGEGKGSAAQVQTVAHLNALVALMLGAAPVCLIGQDLAMPPGQHHAVGARAQDLAPCEAPEDAFLTVEDYEGRPVASRHSFLSMKGVFERLVVEYPERLVNCTEGGIALRGIPNMPLREALAPFVGQQGRDALRHAIRQVWQGYTPTVSEDLPDALAGLRRDVDELALTWAPAVLQAEAQRQRWDGCDPEEDLAHDGLGDAAIGALLALDTTVQRLQTAFGLFVLQDFRIIETLAAVPSGEAWLTDQRQRDQHTCARLATLAAYVQEGAETLRRNLAACARRLADVLVAPSGRDAATLHTLLVRQHYRQALQVVTAPKVMALVSEERPLAWWRMRGYVQILEHTGQFAAALAVLRTWEGMAPGHVGRLERWLGQHVADVRAALPAYFDAEDATGHEPPPAEGASGAYWGA